MSSKSFADIRYPTIAIHRWLLAIIMLSVLALGWRYPLLGFLVPLSVLASLIGGFMRGRYVCGNLCPRGSFFDTFFARITPKRPIPEKFFSPIIREIILAGLMSITLFRLAQNPGSLMHWGLVFWQLFLVTTVIAFILGLIFRSRTWCAICPVGSVSNNLGGHLVQLNISSLCRQCGRCSSNCPMGHKIHIFKKEGIIENRDCLQCSTCVQSCPAAALSLQHASP